MNDDAAKQDRAGVPMANRAGKAQASWSWVERSVWSDRMLAALEMGPKGGKWYSLIDKLVSTDVLHKAFAQVKKRGGAAGVDHVSINNYALRLDRELECLSKDLRNGTYKPSPLRRKWIPKPGKGKEQRPLGIPTVRDRVVHTALKFVMEPIFEVTFQEQSYGFRPGRCAQDALEYILDGMYQGHTWVVDVDLRKFFDTIPHEQLMSLIENKVSDGRILALLRAILATGVLEGEDLQYPEEGAPQGGVISPLLANIYLHGLDQTVAAKGYRMARYADDFVILCRTQDEAESALALVQSWTEEAGLVVHPEKTQVVDMREERASFDFLGFRFLCHRRKQDGQKRLYRFVRPASKQKLKGKLRGYTKRCNGRSLAEIISKINPILRGWHTYFRSAHFSEHERLDQWVRRRLRNILRKRSKRKGICRPSDNPRWPNSFFADLGLFSLLDAHGKYASPLRR